MKEYDELLLERCKNFLSEKDFFNFEKKLPLAFFTPGEGGSYQITALAPYRAEGGRFFYEMTSRWLLPGRRTALTQFYLSNFRMNELEKALYMVMEATVALRSQEEIYLLEQNSALLRKELELGLSSTYHARRILELKGVSSDEKTALIQENITTLFRRFPRLVDYDIFALMQRFLISSREEYKDSRSVRMLSRIVAILYSFARGLSYAIEEAPDKRHLRWKVVRSEVQTLFGRKKILGCFVGLNLIQENERFDKNHLLKALEMHVPGVRAVEDSYFMPKNIEEGIVTLYLEVEKEGGEEFTQEEVGALISGPLRTLQDFVESLEYQIFAERNEEEVMKYIVLLSHQIKRVRDLPQIVIMFDEQRDQRLFFTLVMVRSLHMRSPSLEGLTALPGMDVRIDRVKEVGFVRRRFPKEASVLRISLPVEPFLREDYTVHLYGARKSLFDALERYIGEVRDFNGGMISKQREVFLLFQEMVLREGEKNQLLLENFFYALYPAELRGLVSPELLKEFYFLFLEILSSGRRILYRSGKSAFLILMRLENGAEKEEIVSEIKSLQIPSSQLIYLDFCYEGERFWGYLFLSPVADERERFISVFAIIPEFDYSIDV